MGIKFLVNLSNNSHVAETKTNSENRQELTSLLTLPPTLDTG